MQRHPDFTSPRWGEVAQRSWAGEGALHDGLPGHLCLMTPGSNRPKAYDALIGLGSNIGDKAGNIARAIELLTEKGDVRLVAASRLYRTAPWGVVDQDWFVNACIAVATQLGPHALLDRCLGVETEMKRVRTRHWGPRVIDVDVLVYKNVTLHEAALTLPHPRITERTFVLVPLAEIAADQEIDGRTVSDWLAHAETNDVVPFDAGQK